MKHGLHLLFLVLLAPRISAQTVTSSLSINSLSGLVGHWTGKGQFASGKVIEAEMSFELDTATQAILQRHIDHAPNRYKATSLWTIDRQTGKITALIVDNFGGVRAFIGSENNDTTLVIESSTILAHKATMERFIYHMYNQNRFKMTYEYNQGDGKGWRLRDWIGFVRLKM